MRTLWLGGVAFAASFVLAGAAVAQDLLVGLAGPMTGRYAVFGAQFRNGAEMAVADINTAGGVLGRRLRLEIGDDACDPKQARVVAERLASHRVPIVVGHFCSSASIAASERYAEANVLQISPASTNPQYTDHGLWNTFRVSGRDDQQGQVAGEYLAKTYKDQNIAILHDRSTDGKVLADGTRAALNNLGVKERMHEAYSQGDRDFSDLISRMKAASIDVVYLGGNYTEGGRLLRQMREQGMQAAFVGGDTLSTAEFWALTGPAGEGVRFTFGPDPRSKPTAVEVVQKLKEKGIEPEGYTLHSYAAFQVWAQAATQAGTIEPKKIAEVIKEGKWETVLGTLSFDQRGDLTDMEYVWHVWKDGDYAEVSSTTN